MVQIEKDPSRLEELLELNDRFNGLTKDLVRYFDANGLASPHGATLFHRNPGEPRMAPRD